MLNVNQEELLDLKVVLLGQSGVGKSALIHRLTKGEFPETSDTTIGAAFSKHTFDLEDGTNIQLNIWDTAGQEKYEALAAMYYR